MLIIGCDFHPGFQQVAILDKQTGEVQEKRLRHRDEAEQFYGSLGAPVRVGMEACGHELWLGDAAKIRAGVVRKQKTDRRDADSALADRRPLPQDLDAQPGRARRAAIAGATVTSR